MIHSGGVVFVHMSGYVKVVYSLIIQKVIHTVHNAVDSFLHKKEA